MPRLVPEDVFIGVQLGDYVITRLLATGGMARVFEGVDQRLGRHAAIKVLDTDRLVSDVTLTLRFQREARAIAKLEHPNIISIYQYGEQDGVYFLAMKLIRGNDLAQELHRLRQSGQLMDVEHGLNLLEQVAAALDTAHEANIVHRDIKPSNILIDQNNHAILTDFGLMFQPSVDTTSGASFGTPRYIAPEQALASSSALPQSDLYSLGVIAYQILTGQTPFSAESPLELALAHINNPPPPPRSINPDIPEAAEVELLRVLDKDPANRHKSAGEFVSALRRAYTPGAQPIIPQVVEPAPKPETETSEAAAVEPSLNDTPLPQPSRSWLPIVAVAVLAFVAIGVIGLVASQGGDETPSITPTVISPVPIAEVAEATEETSEIVALPTMTPEPATPEAPPEPPTQPPVAAATGETVTINLVYTDSVFAIVNSTASDLDVSTLRFTRDADQYSGESIVRRVLPGGTCFRLQLQGRQNALPQGCTRLHAETLLPDPMSFFWRTKTDSATAFEVHYQEQLVTTCPTVSRGGAGDCPLTLPVPPAG